MTERERKREASDPTATQAAPEPHAQHPPMRPGRRDQEPIILELAWLVIETARVLSRLRS